MPFRKREARQQYEAVEHLLTGWLRERRSLVARYTEIAVATRASGGQLDMDAQQRDLCEVLVDYVSAGHFEVYLELIEEAESFADGSGALARELMPEIGDTTEFILAYEEKYTANAASNATLERDLAALGEVLESRFTLEDRLIGALHYSHQRQCD
ncbi:Rsd/AlgQ family anti-sigma factor [Mangrovimicrobium sediminis]|uniref:Rsd/AlgQ family anti-sigma factor n=1 Tax=Mangrovimicrobium sediminis TaxID=2562682 RepID=A0A4Z0M2F7_9GAMM|nr:Rsd/AlgQ family anti-sigma factor [Haliea sp. SAOS-164]TGD73873.1 Rsd/AlgQ family anti-sigma factor [Haliea sp. SAOS-164]